VFPSLESTDWGGFLERPRLPAPSVQALADLASQPILITGAAGSIGSALARRLAAVNPRALILLDSAESSLQDLHLSIQRAPHSGHVHTVPGDVRDAALLDTIFATHSPRIVFHTAALKHVPLLEEQPLAAISTNIFGTLALAHVAHTHKAHLILLSTDKTVSPASVLGATKRAAECIVLSHGGIALRLGNVLATRGSVAEVFASQLASGTRVTITSPSARRYFLTVEEAVDLLLLAACESDLPSLLAPHLTRQHLITDLAHYMAQSLCPDRSLTMQFAHLRSGEKESELLWSPTETATPSRTPGLLCIASSHRNALPSVQLNMLEAATKAREIPEAITLLRKLVPDYTPSAAVTALVGQAVTA
jgi:FlaA1/EpsC-like NDP-sugar epimerase